MKPNGQFYDHLYVHQWDVNDPKGMVLVAHGMAEHGARYAAFASFLNQHGWGVWAMDHRGHGKTGERAGKLGYLADDQGWELAAKDVLHTSEKIKDTYPHIPLILFGHSAGSILALYSTLFLAPPINGLILSAFAPHPGMLLNLGLGVAKLMCAVQGKDKPGTLMNALTFGDFNKPFKPAKTDFDWLSTDPDQVNRYIQDPYCGFVCCNGYFVDMLSGLKKVHKVLDSLPPTLPILVLAGSDDPVVGFAKGAQKVIDQLKAINPLVKGKIYPGMRHELLNETNRELVYNDILNWINEVAK